MSKAEYDRAKFDLKLWRKVGLKRDNFTNILFYLIAKADPGRKEKLRTVFPVECQVFDDWHAASSSDEFFETKP